MSKQAGEHHQYEAADKQTLDLARASRRACLETTTSPVSNVAAYCTEGGHHPLDGGSDRYIAAGTPAVIRSSIWSGWCARSREQKSSGVTEKRRKYRRKEEKGAMCSANSSVRCARARECLGSKGVGGVSRDKERCVLFGLARNSISRQRTEARDERIKYPKKSRPNNCLSK